MPMQPTANAPALYCLTIGNTAVEALHSFGGLGLVADLSDDLSAPGSGLEPKHVANVRWTPAKAEIGIGMGKAMYDWIRSAFGSGGNAWRDGAFTVTDPNGKVTAETDYFHAQLTGFTVPRLDASSKEPGRFEVVFEAEQVRWAPTGGSLESLVSRPKPWIVSHFKFEFGGLPCSRIAAIESFAWTCPVVRDPLSRDGSHPGKVTIPDLTLTISSADYAAWAAAAKSWFIDGRHLAADEQAARLTLFGPSLAADDVLGEFTFSGVGFKAFQPADVAVHGDAVGRFTVVLYVEGMVFSMPAFDNA